ncbi:MAG TPA: PIN domain-containing protein [Candidatus Polarisedimenticolaceae bacterium]|nr:PIN domain-containing protein [Candidatus Polarisedimenticolaceae bacterium]
MIALDTSSLIAFLSGDRGRDVESIDQALELGQAALPPVVITEMLSHPGLNKQVSTLILGLPVLEPHPGFWERAAATRAAVLARKLRARLADTLISQSCIDHGVPLITRDRDFLHFAKHAGLSII